MLKITAVLIGISLFFSTGLFAFDPGTYLKNRVVTVRLKNGITAVLLNRGYAPTLAFNISFRVGSADESYRTAGAAHLLEHMLFKGTDKIGTTDFAKEGPIQARIEAVGETLDRLKISNPRNSRIPELEKELDRLHKEQSKYIVNAPYDAVYSENGGVGFNASTSRDATGYYVELPSDRLELWARLESERLRNPVMREYYLERNNVIQERLMRYDSSGTGLLFEQFVAAAFEAHPYRHPIIGWKSGIGMLSIEDVKRFYYSYYIPSRMTVTIVGKQDTAYTISVLERYFGRIPERPNPPEPSLREEPRRGERRITLNFESTPSLVAGWNKPTFPNADDFSCDVMAEILAVGKNSYLHKRLVIDKKTASSVDAWSGTPGSRYDNVFAVFASPAPGVSVERIEKDLYDAIDEFFNSVNEDDIKRIVNRMESELVFRLGKNQGLAHVLSYYQTVFGDWRYAADFAESVKKVTPSGIRALKEKYFHEANRTVAVLRDTRKPKEASK
jgi:predicted Zn-dependent peptidase